MTQALEEQIAHLTRTVEDLSDVMAKQDSELRRLGLLVDQVLVTDMQFGEQKTSGGIILGDDDGKTRGIYIDC